MLMFVKSFNRISVALAIGVAAAAASGCAHQGPARVLGPLSGPEGPAPVKAERWYFRNTPARMLQTPHYSVHTTIEDDEIAVGVAQLMEGALTEYRLLAPDVLMSPAPMDCYIFQSRSQWANFTQSHTGADAPIYLQINRGGYTVRDWYVAYFIGDAGTYSVAAHEGFHQFIARHFKTRPPPFLEEGLACMFEQVKWETVQGVGRLPRWDLANNTSRIPALRNALEDGRLMPLSHLIVLHAGKVIDRPAADVEAFDAGSWAFARFLWEADGARYRPALQRLLADAASGNLFSGGGLMTTYTATWNPQSVRPMLEHYLDMPLDQIDRAYRRYAEQIVRRADQGNVGNW